MARELERTKLDNRYVHADGSGLGRRRQVSLVREEAARCVAIVQVQDVTERKHAEEELKHQAKHDALTGLPNRRKPDAGPRGADSAGEH